MDNTTQISEKNKKEEPDFIKKRDLSFNYKNKKKICNLVLLLLLSMSP